MGTNGINLREQDLYDAFRKVIDQCIERKPDLVIHSGDFFHRPSPPNRPMIFALEQMRRLSDAQIPIVIIAGNHSTPKTIYTSPILKAFKTIDGIYPVFGQKYEQLTFGDLIIHGLPHINDDQIQLEELKKVKIVKGFFNILMLHTSIGKDYMMEEFGEKLFPPERMKVLSEFDYVALGHWHNFQKVRGLENAWYSGSTERMSDTEVGKEKGFCWLELQKGQAVVPEFIPIPTRPWYRIDIKDCQQKSVEEIEKEIVESLADMEIEGVIINLYLHQIESLQSVRLSNNRIRELLQGPIHIQIRRQFSDIANSYDDLINPTESLDKILGNYIIENTKDKEKAKQLAEKARYYFDLYDSGEYKNR